METSNPTNNTTDQQQHASTYTPGEDSNRLASAAQYFGIRNTRTPLRPIREQNLQTESDSMQQQQQQIQIQNQDQQSYQRNTNKSPNNETNTNFTNQQHHPTEFDSKSILKFGSTVWNNVGMVFSDSTLEAARMHSVGVTAAEEHVAGDGTLHLRSIVRRMKTKKPPVMKLGDMFKPPLEEGVGQEITFEMEGGEEEEEVEYEEVVVDTVEGGSIPAAIFGIIKGMVGPAVLYLPRGFAISGYAIAIPAMFCATISYLYCATRLLQCWKVESDKMMQQMEKIKLLLDPEANNTNNGSSRSERVGGEYGSLLDGSKTSNDVDPQIQGKMLTYPELARKAFGKFAFLISGGIAGMQFGVCLTYLIFVPQNFYELFHNVFGIIVPKQLILIGMLLIEIPLCWIRDIRKLTPINILATVLIAFGLCSVLFIALFHDNGEVDVDSNKLTLVQEISHLPKIQDTWALFIGTSVSFSYAYEGFTKCFGIIL